MSHLSLDDFEWVERGFDLWGLQHKTYNSVVVASINHFNGWHVKVLNDPSAREPLHVDSLDAAKALAQIIASQHMEFYHGKYLNGRPLRQRVKTEGPPTFRPGVFKVG